jgi:glycosyltransferase involved in cell wall biosynthesis
MRVLLTLWADPSMYLATIFTSQLLSERGVKVDLVYRSPNKEFDVAGNIDFGSNACLHPIGGGRAGWQDKLDYIFYVFKLISTVRQKRPKVIIGYNKLGLLASFVVTKICPNTKLIYHNYDFDISKLKDILGRCELMAARKADLTIFPSRGRAKEYKAIASLKKDPMSVLNCYPVSYKLERTGELRKILESRGLRFDRLVIRLGMIGPFHGIESTLRSILEWKENWGFVMCGFSSEDYLQKIDQLIKELGLEEKVLILPSVSNSLWYDVLCSADLGISLYNQDPNNIGHTYMAGTSQKLNGYFVKGIPSIVPNTPDFISFVAHYGTSILADVSNPTSIAQAINSILEDEAEYQRCRENVKKSFLAEFNFEKQFEPVFKWIESS